MIRCIRTFDPYVQFKDKKIAIIGPADSAFENANGEYIDSFDFVIRINKAPHSWTDEKSKYLGTKSDILFHSFYENSISGGGVLDIDLYKAMGIRFLINPRTTFSSYRRTFNFFRKYLKKQKVYHLPVTFYKEMQKPFGSDRPTVGFAALFSALRSECELVFISGFTFFRTPYASGYRDHLRDMERNLEHIKEQGVHDIQLEYELFKKNVENTRCRKVVFDHKLEKIIETDYETVH